MYVLGGSNELGTGGSDGFGDLNVNEAFMPSSAPYWPMFQHDPRHTGRSQADTSANPGTQKWAFATGGIGYGAPAIGAMGPFTSARRTTTSTR